MTGNVHRVARRAKAPDTSVPALAVPVPGNTTDPAKAYGRRTGDRTDVRAGENGRAETGGGPDLEGPGHRCVRSSFSVRRVSRQKAMLQELTIPVSPWK
ncbi:hypothetical protein GCM10017600_23570 [Streptosporangium carneum]|uniref:Uncharacterized protein n=1 Tax=Streptosporangium carneum TaxID=47481 RepID=A0A9W6MCA0_9ACTN|nr:hypothetical protein GCM10017600_23570 [Streptosporangium carneum]